MTWAHFDSLIVGLIVIVALVAIFSHAWKNTGSACNQNCNQGRNCNCGTK